MRGLSWNDVRSGPRAIERPRDPLVLPPRPRYNAERRTRPLSLSCRVPCDGSSRWNGAPDCDRALFTTKRRPTSSRWRLPEPPAWKKPARPGRGAQTLIPRVPGNEIRGFANRENPRLRISVSKCRMSRGHLPSFTIPRAHSDAPRPELAIETRPIRIGTVVREFTEDRDR